MITEDELWRFRQAGFEMAAVKMQIRELTATMDGLKAQQISDMPRGNNGPHSAVEDVIIRLEDLRELYARKLSAWYTRQAEIEAAMEALVPQEATVIRLYYFNCERRWKDVAKKAGTDPRNLRRIKESALKKMLEN